MFVVDVSGSNESTDNDGRKRADNIDRFVAGLDQKGFYQYGLIVFNSHQEAVINYNGDTRKARFTGDPNELYQATQSIRDNPFKHGTKYGPTLAVAKQAIEEDIRLFPEETSAYAVLFISDGKPHDSSPLAPLDGVSNLVNINDRSVYLSTAYYGGNGSQAIELLQEMAHLGSGNFVNFENGEYWDLNELVVERDLIPWSLKEFLVYNLNAGFCMDGEVGVDSDVDGMCDRDEIAMNNIYAEKLEAEGKLFDPANRFSFGDGYGDFFHWLRFRYPGKTLPLCEDRSDDDFDLLTVCEEREIKNTSPHLESYLRTGNPESFDTDRDGIIDGIETFVYFASQSTGRATRYTAALDRENLKDNPDGEKGNVLVQIKEHRNPWVYDSHAEAYDTRLTPMYSLDGDCHQFTQTILPLYETLEVKERNTLPGLGHGAGENSIMVYYIQVLQTRLDSVGILNHSVQKINRGPLSGGLRVNDKIFDKYIPPEEE